MKSIRYSGLILMKFKFSRKIFEKYSNMKFHENPSSGSRDVPCGQTNGLTETDRQTDMMKLIAVFRNSAKAPKNKTWTIYLNSLRIQIKYDLSLLITPQKP
jgi:hypothetical protein